MSYYKKVIKSASHTQGYPLTITVIADSHEAAMKATAMNETAMKATAMKETDCFFIYFYFLSSLSVETS